MQRLLVVGLGILLSSTLPAARSAEVPPKKDGKREIRVGEILLIGNTVTRADVVRRALPFAPDEAVTPGQLRIAQRNLERLNLFKNATVELSDLLSEQPPYKNVLIRIEERRKAGGFGLHCLDGLERATEDTFWGQALVEIEATSATNLASALALVLFEDLLDSVGNALLVVWEFLISSPCSLAWVASTTSTDRLCYL